MPHLDFFTLYVTVIFVAFSLAVVWGTIALKYRDHIAARFWCAACVLITMGASLLPFQETAAAAVVPAALGNGLIIFGFWLLWCGLRRFVDKSAGWPLAIGLSGLSVAFAIAFFTHTEIIALVYAIGQSIPMVLSIALLVRRSGWGAGAWLTSAGICVGLLGHVIVIGINLSLLGGIPPTASFAFITSATMLGVIFCGILWNYGFAVMTIEKLRGEVIELANRDALTGLWNRRKFDQELALANAASGRSGRSYGLLLLDIDHFKVINDQLGHKGGDASLAHFAAVAEACLRQTDLMARLGGDEFAVLMPDASAFEARILGERIARALSLRPIRFGGQQICLSCSIGGSVWSCQTANDPDSVFCRADEALYSVKADGRNGVAIAPPLLAPVSSDDRRNHDRTRVFDRRSLSTVN